MFVQIIDLHVGESGEVIANIPIKIKARAVFSKFVLSPHTDINFGPTVVNDRIRRSFTLKNEGEFEFKYAIVKKPTAAESLKKQQTMKAQAARGQSKSREGQNSLHTSQTKMGSGAWGGGGGGGGKSRAESSIRTEVVSGTQKLVLGMFTISPAMGAVSPGESADIKVDCAADKPGKQEVAVIIEISERYKRDSPVVYHIYGDVLEPMINTSDIAAIFEEHGVCQSLGVLGPQLFHSEDCIGVYGEAEQRFAFKSIAVGKTARARFKISNTNKIPCDIKLTVSAASNKQKGPVDAFEVEPKSKITVPSHSHIHATLSFCPPAIQTYTAIFEAYPDRTQSKDKQKSLTFEVQGEGNLPQVGIVHPTLRNAKGQPLLVFRRLLTTQSQTLRVTLKNIGTVPATTQMQTKAGRQHFSPGLPDNNTTMHSQHQLARDKERGKRKEERPLSPPLLMDLAVGETRDFTVVFSPVASEKCRGELSVRIQNNQYEVLPIQLVGEGYQDDISVHNIRGGEEMGAVGDEEEEEVRKLQPEEVEGEYRGM